MQADLPLALMHGMSQSRFYPVKTKYSSAETSYISTWTQDLSLAGEGTKN